jgi:hypothetical protein
MKLPAAPQDKIFDKRTAYHKTITLCDPEHYAQDQKQKKFITKTRNFLYSFRAFNFSCFAAIRLEKRPDYLFKNASQKSIRWGVG